MKVASEVAARTAEAATPASPVPAIRMSTRVAEEDRMGSVVEQVLSPVRKREILARYELRSRVFEERSRRAAGRLAAPAAPTAAHRGLTRREAQVLGLVAQGLPTPELAHTLGISPHSVDSHVRKTMTKLGAANRAHAVALALRAGVLES
jgi:DNA-binding CsgD family transcriptional regulator